MYPKNSMKKQGRWAWVLAGVLLIAMVAIARMALPRPGTFTLEVQPTTSGWGYLIRQQGRVIIDQPTIPVVPGQRSFATQQQAQRVGELVLTKMRAGHFPPTLSLSELDSLGAL